MNRLMAFLAFAILTGFLGILLYYVPRIDLGVVIVVTVLLVAWDFLTATRGKSN